MLGTAEVLLPAGWAPRAVEGQKLEMAGFALWSRNNQPPGLSRASSDILLPFYPITPVSQQVQGIELQVTSFYWLIQVSVMILS